MSYSIETKCIHLENDDERCDTTGALSFPIYQTATFVHKQVGQTGGYDYSRLNNPTRERLEHIVAELEHGVDALAFSSGMAAVATVMELFQPGDHLIIDNDLYGGSIRLFDHINLKNGIHFTRVDCCKEDVTQYITPNTKAVYIETPTNPMMNVTDIQKLAEITKQNNLLCIVDNTFLSPYFQNPLKLGADIVIHSGTKYLGGHNDTIAGFVVVGDANLSERLRFVSKTTGAGLAPFDSWLIMRGIKTLGVRMEKAQANAQTLAQWLLTQSCVTRVIYPGLPEHPGYQIMKKQSRSFGAMLTFEVKSRAFAHTVLENTTLIRFAESLGGTETLITYPVTQTHADVPPEQLQKNGITDRILRMSVGIEAAEDLIADLSHAFQMAKRQEDEEQAWQNET